MSVNLATLQNAIGAVLDDISTITAVMGAPDALASYPFLTIGETEAYDSSTQCVDGSRVYFPVHIWTKEQGFTQVKALDAEIRTLLDGASLTVANHIVVSCFYRGSRFMRDPERGIRHGITEFDIEIEAVVP